MKSLNIKNDIKKIVHIADVHIRLLKRRDEYNTVFQNLYKQLKDICVDNDVLIYIAGDIVHSKTEMSPELVKDTATFLYTLSTIAPTVLIAGNHDANLRNNNRLDALSPIISLIDSNNLYYMRDNGLYNINNKIVFSVMSAFDSVDNYITSDKIDDKYIKIATYHGVVNNSLGFNGFSLSNEKINLSLFNGFDYTLLGDIHKHQYLDSNNTIAYAGSLIAQNYGEVGRHGFILWDLIDKSSKYIAVDNDFGYITVNIEDGVIQYPADDVIYKNSRVRVVCNNTNEEDINKLVDEIKIKYKPVEFVLSKHKSMGKMYSIDSKIDHINLRDVACQEKLLIEYLNSNYKVNEQQINRILAINKEFNDKISSTINDDVARNVKINMKRFKFSNMFSYGEDNEMDFTKMGGLVGLFEKNAQGKTSLWEAVTYCLFDKCSKSFKAENILNNRKKSFTCEINFSIDDVDFYIKRVGTAKKNGDVSVKVEFWKVDGGKVEMLNGLKRQDTNANIRSYIGSYDDFILTALSSQNNNSNFIDKGQADRKDILVKFMDLDIYDKLLNVSSVEYRRMTVLISEYENRDFDKEIENINTDLFELKSKYQSLNSNKDLKLISKQNIEDSILEYTKKLIDVDKSIMDIDSLINQKSENERKTNITVENKETELKNKSIYDDKIKELDVELESYISKNLDVELKKLNELKTKLNSLNNEKDKYKILVGNSLDKINKLGNLEYDPDCTYCMNNVFVKDAINNKELLEQYKKEVSEIISSITKYTSDIELYKTVESDIRDMNILKTELNSYTAKSQTSNTNIAKIETLLVSLNNQREMILEKIDKYYKSKSDIENNTKIESEISIKKNDLYSINTEINDIESNIRNVYGKMEVLNSQIKRINDDILKYDGMKNDYVCYEYYTKSVQRDGVPYKLISLIVPYLESEINNILSQMVQFSIKIELDDKNINVSMVYDDNRECGVEMASGMERFIIGLAFRVSLIKICNLPKFNFLTVDEGFSVNDADNMSNLPPVLEYLKSFFDFVFIISHIDFMRDFVDVMAELKNVDGFSNIQNV